MPTLSIRGNELPQSPIRSLVPYSRTASKAGVHVHYLNIGQPDIQTPVEALNVVKESEAKVIPYGPSEGLFPLREKVAGYLTKFDAQVSKDEVMVTTGASEAILFTLMSCLDYRDEVIIPEPFYANYLGFSQMAGVRIVPLTTHFETQFALPPPEKFEEIITPRTRAIMLCNPSNPTGQMYDAEELLKLLDIAKRNNLFLIVDEVYREFSYDKKFTSVLSFKGMEDHVVVIDSISKVFSSCGARVGFIITKNQQIRNTVNKYAQLRLCPPHFGQKMAEACYDNPEPYISNAREEYRKRRSILYEGLKKIEGIKSYMPDAAFYNIVELPVDDATEFCKWLLTDFRLNDETVMLAPAGGFYFNRDLGKKQVRIAYILNSEKLTRALHCLEVGLKQYQTSVVTV